MKKFNYTQVNERLQMIIRLVKAIILLPALIQSINTLIDMASFYSRLDFINEHIPQVEA